MDYVIFYLIWTGNLLGSDLQLYLLDTLLALDLEILELQILTTITIFNGIWTLKYLDYSLDFHCYLPYWIRT